MHRFMMGFYNTSLDLYEFISLQNSMFKTESKLETVIVNKILMTVFKVLDSGTIATEMTFEDCSSRVKVRNIICLILLIILKYCDIV